MGQMSVSITLGCFQLILQFLYVKKNTSTMDLSDWFSDFLNKKLEAGPAGNDEDENDDSFDRDDDDTAEAYLDPEWYAKDRNVKKYIPKLSAIALGKVVKMVNTLATSESGLEQLPTLRNRLPEHLRRRLLAQLSFTALRNFLEMPSVSSCFDLADPNLTLTTLLGSIKQEEDLFRYLYHLHPEHPFLKTKESSLLINIFNNAPAFDFGHNEVLETIPTITCQESLYKRNGKSSINDRDTFEKRWNIMTNGCFTHLNWDNVFVAGGSVLHCLRSFTDEEFDSIVNNDEDMEDNDPKILHTTFPESLVEWDGQAYRKVDFDLFIYGLNEEDTRKKVYEIYEAVLKVNPQAHVAIRKNTVNIFGPKGFKPIQMILCRHKSPAEVLLNFDLNCVSVGFDGKNVLALPKFILAMKYGRNYLDSNMNTAAKLQYYRLIKYAARGFPTALPVHFRMHGYFDQEIPSQDELAADTSHPVFYYICELLHLAKRELITNKYGSKSVEGFHWQDLWQRGIMINGERKSGPKRQAFKGINLPIKSEEDLTVFTKSSMKPFYGSPPKYDNLPIDFNIDLKWQLSSLKHSAEKIISPEAPEALVQAIASKNISFYNDNETLQPFYLNSFVETKSYSVDVDQLTNPYLAINTSLATVEYNTHTTTIFIDEYSNIEYGRISSDPFELSGARWKLSLHSGKGKSMIFVHLEKLPKEEEDSDALLPSLVAANFLIAFSSKEAVQMKKKLFKPTIALDGSKLFTNTSNSWSTFLHGAYIDNDAKNPYAVKVPNPAIQCIEEDRIRMEVTIQVLKITTPAIAL